MQASDKKITSRIVTENGTQYIEVNGERLAGVAYITYLRDNNRYEEFARAGFRLFSTVVFFGDNKLNENSGLDFFSKGIFDGERADFSGFDRDIENILRVAPDAYIFPRVNTSPSEEWERTHPSELCDAGSIHNPTRKRACLASDEYREEVKRNLTRFIEHIEASPYRDHIVGYQLVGGNTEEWIPYDGNAFSPDPSVGRTAAFVGLRSREKYAKFIKDNSLSDTDENFYNFHADVVCDRILEFSELVKEKTEHRLIVGCFYGYSFELCHKNGMHQRLFRILDSDAIDFFCSPVSYAHTRPLGIEHAYMVPLDTLKLHGKLYFSENDTRTHLSRPVNDMPSYNSPIWFGHPKEDTLEVLKMHYSRALINGHALWWFDMWGGWYSDKDYMAFMKRSAEISKENVGRGSRSVSEVALFVDESSYSKVSDNKTVQSAVYKPRRAIGLSGAPIDLYLASDFERVKEKYKAYILLVPTETPLTEMIKSYAECNDKDVLEITPEGSNIETEEIREFLQGAGVHIYTSRPAVVYANESYVFIHTGEEGEYELTLPSGACYRDVFTDKPLDGKFVSKLGRSYLIRK